MDELSINTLIKEYFTHFSYTTTLQSLEQEEKQKNVQPKRRLKKMTSQQLQQMPKLVQIFQWYKDQTQREEYLQKHLLDLKKNYQNLVSQIRSLYHIANDCVSKFELVDKQLSEKYKIELQKYFRLLQAEQAAYLNYSQPITLTSHTQNTQQSFNDSQHHQQTMSQQFQTPMTVNEILDLQNFNDLKNQYDNIDENDLETLTELFYRIRIQALTISPKQRRKFVLSLINNKVINNQKFLLNNLFEIKNTKLRNSCGAVFSIIASTISGAKFLVNQCPNIIINTYNIIQSQEIGSITQRFYLALLQKLSVLDISVEIILESQMLEYFMTEIMFKALIKCEPVHPFILDFTSALIANCTQKPKMLDPNLAIKITQILLQCIKPENYMKHKVANSVILHLLICISSLSYDSQLAEQCQIGEIVGEFVGFYSSQGHQSNLNSTEFEDQSAETATRQMILDQCAHIFHPKNESQDLDTSELTEWNVKKNMRMIMEYEEKAEEDDDILVFEAFPDEVF